MLDRTDDMPAECISYIALHKVFHVSSLHLGGGRGGVKEGQSGAKSSGDLGGVGGGGGSLSSVGWHEGAGWGKGVATQKHGRRCAGGAAGLFEILLNLAL